MSGSRRSLDVVILVDAQRIAASRPGKPLFEELSVTVATGDRLGVVGLNGSGKSTLLRLLAAQDLPEAGVVRHGRSVRVAVLDQEAVLPSLTAFDAVASVGGARAWEAGAVLDRLGMANLGAAPVEQLSGGQAKRVALARALVTECDLLVLDEPTNHLDIDAIDWLEDRLASFRGGLVLVSHDRHLLDRLTTRVLELDRGRGYLHDGGYDVYLANRAAREEHAAAAEASRRILARSELAWLRRGAPARTSKSKARTRRATEIVEARPESPARTGTPDLTDVTAEGAPAAKGWAASRHTSTPRLGDKVIELAGVGHQWSGGPPLLRDVDLLLDNRERLGIVGPNGSGKSTLLDILAGRLEPTEGSVEVGPTVRIGYYSQRGPDLDPSMRVCDAVAGPARTPDERDAALLERFWFGPDAQRAPVSLLSGGERRRLQILLVLATQPNVLLFDEPTNDLDLDTLRLLEEFFDDWPGALVVVSHDRAFLERTVEEVLLLDGSGQATRRPGGYAAWLEERRSRRQVGRAAPAMEAPGSARAAPSAPAGSKQGQRAAGGRSASTIRHELRGTERRLATLERRRTELEAELASAGNDHVALRRLGDELGALSAELAEVEERWLALSDEQDRRRA